MLWHKRLITAESIDVYANISESTPLTHYTPLI